MKMEEELELDTNVVYTCLYKPCLVSNSNSPSYSHISLLYLLSPAICFSSLALILTLLFSETFLNLS